MRVWRFLCLTLLLAVWPLSCSRHPSSSISADQQLSDALEKDDVIAVRRALENGANIELRMNGQETPLIRASRSSNLALVKLLLEHGADATAKDQQGETSLVHAAYVGNAEIVKALLEKSHDIGEKNHALFAVTSSGAATVVILPETESTSPEQASQNIRVNSPWYKVTKLLLDSGASVEARDEENRTPLINAAAHGQTELFNLLLERGADIQATDKYGNTALIAAACECAVATMPSTYDIVKTLLERGAEVNARTKDGTTALMSAAAALAMT